MHLWYRRITAKARSLIEGDNISLVKLALQSVLLATCVAFGWSPYFGFTHGEIAAVFAIGAASSFFVNHIPERPIGKMAKAAERSAPLITGALIFLTGWHWLRDEAGDDIWPVFIPALVAWGVLALALAVFSILQRRED